MQKELHKLKYAINLARQKLEEPKKNIQDEEEDDQRKTIEEVSKNLCHFPRKLDPLAQSLKGSWQASWVRESP